MKKEPFLWTGLGGAIFLSLVLAVHFRDSQHQSFFEMHANHASLQQTLKNLNEDVVFVKTHQKEISFLLKKKWFIPENRLIAGDILEKLKGSLSIMRYTFESERKESIGEGHIFKITKMVFEVGAPLDSDIFAFIQTLSEKFRGILRAREIVLTREKDVNFVQGKLVFDWVAMNEEDHGE